MIDNISNLPRSQLFSQMEFTTRRPATTGIFCIIFVQKAFKKDDNVFFSKKHSFFIIFSNFSNFKSFLIFCQKKNFIFRAENAFLRNQTIWYACYSKFATLDDFEKESRFLLKKPIYFFRKKTKFFYVLRNLTFWGAFYSKFSTIHSKIPRSETWMNIVNAIGKQRLKNAPFEWKIMLPYFINMAQNNKVANNFLGSNM